MPTDLEPATDLARLWRGYSRKVYGPRYALYEALAAAVSEDPELLEMIRSCRPAAHDPNMLMASVQFLVLGGVQHPLADLYRAAADFRPGTVPADAGAHMHGFCLEHRNELVELMSTRHVQTNETGRCGGLALGMAEAAVRLGEPLAFIDDGASAGLNLAIDRFLLDFGPAGTIGPEDSRLRLPCELRGQHRPSHLRLPAIADRVGIDRSPVDLADEDATRWLLACIWPGTGRQGRARKAMGVAAEMGVAVRRGDMVDDLAGALEEMRPAPTVVVTSVSYSYLAPQERERFVEVMADEGRRRPVAWVCCDLLGTVGMFDPGPPRSAPEGNSCALGLAFFDGDHIDSKPLAYMHAHGDWLSWLPGT